MGMWLGMCVLVLVLMPPAALGLSAQYSLWGVLALSLLNGSILVAILVEMASPLLICVAASSHVLFTGIALLSALFIRSNAAKRLQAVEGSLPSLLSSGTIRLLSAEWLRGRPLGFELPRRQELEKMDGALVHPAEFVRLLKKGRVGALTYCWADRAVHQGGRGPDAHGFHSAVLRTLLQTRWGRWRVKALMIDYASLYQADAAKGVELKWSKAASGQAWRP